MLLVQVRKRKPQDVKCRGGFRIPVRSLCCRDGSLAPFVLLVVVDSLAQCLEALAVRLVLFRPTITPRLLHDFRNNLRVVGLDHGALQGRVRIHWKRSRREWCLNRNLVAGL